MSSPHTDEITTTITTDMLLRTVDDDAQDGASMSSPRTEEPKTTRTTDTPLNIAADAQDEASMSSGHGNIQLEDFHINLDLENDDAGYLVKRNQEGSTNSSSYGLYGAFV